VTSDKVNPLTPTSLAAHFIKTHLAEHPEPALGIAPIMDMLTRDDHELSEAAAEAVLQDPRVRKEKMPLAIDPDPNNMWVYLKNMDRAKVLGWIQSISH